MGLVFDVAHREAGSDETVVAVLNSLLGAGDDRALEVGIALHVDVETAVTGLDAALLGHAGVVAVDVALAVADAAGYACTDGDAAADVLLLAVVQRIKGSASLYFRSDEQHYS